MASNEVRRVCKHCGYRSVELMLEGKRHTHLQILLWII